MSDTASSDLALLQAGLSALLSRDVEINHENSDDSLLKHLQGSFFVPLEDLLVSIKQRALTQSTGSSSENIRIFMKPPFPAQVKVFSVDVNTSADELYQLAANVFGCNQDKLRLRFAGRQIQPGQSLADFGLVQDATLDSFLILRGGAEKTVFIGKNNLDPAYYYDFRNIQDVGVTFFRGGEQYFRPCGWKRYALKVLDKYDSGNNVWLGAPSHKTRYDSTPNEWAVSYHGTAKNNGKLIAQEGYDLSKGTRFLYGKGIYSTPDINVAALYSVEFELSRKTYKLVVQNRVKPDAIKKIPAEVTGVGEYWVVEKAEDIRPYGICFLEV